MSFILDALKKSEADRQQTGASEFAALPSGANKPATPRWLWMVGALLAINLVVLLGLLMRPDVVSVDGATPATTDSNDNLNAVEPLPATNNAASKRFEDRVAVARQELPPQQAQPAPQRVVDRAPAVTAKQPPVVTANLVSQNPDTVASKDLYPTLQELRVNSNHDIPELHLDIHVYNDAPSARFVFINMTKLREGESPATGLRIREITPDGVLLDHQGQTFLLPRE